MLNRQTEVRSDLSKEEIIQRLMTVSKPNCNGKFAYFGLNEFSFRMEGSPSLLRYIPKLRVTGTIERIEAMCIIKYKISPYIGFWVIVGWIVLAALILVFGIVETTNIFLHLMFLVLLVVFFLIIILDLLGQLDICQVRIERRLAHRNGSEK